jgi:FtsH-binding integral membrane protein
VKKCAKLAIAFSVCFAALFLAAAGARFLALRVEWARTFPQMPETVLGDLITAAHWALSLAVYGGLLAGLSYAVRKHIPAPGAVLCIAALALGFSFALNAALAHWEQVPQAQIPVRRLGEAGLILSNGGRSTDTAIVLLTGPQAPRGPRVAAVPGQPLLYQSDPAVPGGSVITMPPAPFRNETPWFLKSLAIDLRLEAEQMIDRYRQGLFPFLMYAGALIFFLSSLTFIFKLSAWPLANLFTGCLVFRGVLALETFFNSPEMQSAFDSFLKDMLPVPLAVPLIFFGCGTLVYIYSLLVFLAKKRGDDED